MGTNTTGLAGFYLPASGETGYKSAFDAAMQAADNVITLAARRGTYVLTKYSPSAAFSLSDVYTTIPGSSVSFTPSSISQKIKYQFTFHARNAGSDSSIYVRMYRNGVLTSTPFVKRWPQYSEERLSVTYILDGWSGASTLELKARQYSSAPAARLHEIYLLDGGTSTQLADAFLEISATI
jgi:hypothetical protein